MPSAYDSSYVEEARELLSSIKSVQNQDSNLDHLSAELAALMMHHANTLLSKNEKKRMVHFKETLEQIKTKAFVFESIDLLFRSKDNFRTAEELTKLLNCYGLPETFAFHNRLAIHFFSFLSKNFANLTIPLIKKTVISNFTHHLVSDDITTFEKYLKAKNEEKSPLNIVLIKEEAQGEKEAGEQIQTYLNLLSNPNIDYISIKISAISSKVKVEAFDNSIENIAHNLRKIYRAAMSAYPSSKFVNIDMESYDYFAITIGVFKKVLEEEEFKNFYAGITLQSYLPNSFPILKTLIKWAKKRKNDGGAPIKISLTKGAYLQLEQVISSENGWPQACYLDKVSTDANYKRMVSYALLPENVEAAHIDLCTHNIFDISYALVLKNAREINSNVNFQMFDGKITHLRKTLEIINQNSVRLYSPVFQESRFDEAISYIHRRLEENLGSENFFKFVTNLSPKSEAWEILEESFLSSIEKIGGLSSSARRSFGKKSIPITAFIYGQFENEANTDFTLPSKIHWEKQILKKGQEMEKQSFPAVITNNEIINVPQLNFSPSSPNQPIYSYSFATENEISLTIETAKNFEKFWCSFPLEEKRKIIARAAAIFREKRAHFIEIMMIESGKTFVQADCEVSEAIDIIQYYQTRISKIIDIEEIEVFPIGTIFVVSARSFPYSSSIGGIVASLITGNCVLFKPPPTTLLTGYHLVKAFWEAGIPKEVLQFIICSDRTIEKFILKDKRISSVILSGKSTTVEKFLKINPLLDLSASSEGKNKMIVSAMCDRPLAIKNLIHSAFTFSGQLYSSTSIAILENEVYNDPLFRKKLIDAASNLKVGSIWQAETDIGPLMHQPFNSVIKELTTLHGHERWLLKPIQNSSNPLLWSPGIKEGITTSSPLYHKFIPAPLLGLMRADNFSHALKLAGSTKYGLSANLQSLAEDDYEKWKSSIEAGNLYINNTSIKSLIRRTPFGGSKKSSYGIGFKTGGPNYLLRCVEIKQKSLPQGKHPVNEQVNGLTSFLENIDLSAEELGLWYASIANYSFWWQKLKTHRDPIKIIGQDNLFGYIPLSFISVRVTDKATPLDILRICAACLTCSTPFELSFQRTSNNSLDWSQLSPFCHAIEESEEKFIHRSILKKRERVRIATKAKIPFKMALARHLCFVNDRPVLASARIELLNYVREVSICKNYHRYGNLGTRENELRKPVV
jgi:RHH-type transcriptional regulator, proline utilization regulon repressor / proline dehydrogenase / delta 1-pyrroline-5-carboxylate dehydrogenase